MTFRLCNGGRFHSKSQSLCFYNFILCGFLNLMILLTPSPNIKGMCSMIIFAMIG